MNTIRLHDWREYKNQQLKHNQNKALILVLWKHNFKVLAKAQQLVMDRTKV